LAVPELSDPIKLKAYLAAEHAASRVVLAENEKEVQLRDLSEGSREVALAIGPEGGWADSELEQFTNSGWTAASLGSTILRAETAAIAALAVVQALSE
jgi:16S rRNA (uracil1498-N3)-methyltransferase